MIIKIIGLFFLTMAMFGIGYFCGHALTKIKYEIRGRYND